MATMEERVHWAAVSFFKHHDYEIIQDGFGFPGFSVDLIVKDPKGSIVFVVEKIKDESSEYGFNPPLTDDERRSFRQMLLAFLDTHEDIVDVPIRLDYFGAYPRGNRALIEHHIGAEKYTA